MPLILGIASGNLLTIKTSFLFFFFYVALTMFDFDFHLCVLSKVVNLDAIPRYSRYLRIDRLLTTIVFGLSTSLLMEAL